MSQGPFEPSFEDLPDTLPVFPLTGVLLLPRARLPLNVFEPRYLAMVGDALAAPARLIGMVQPAGEGGGANPAIYPVGCAGRIVAFSETDDGRYVITLGGVCRFAVRDELPLQPGGYRRVAADWSGFRADLEPEEDPALDRRRLVEGLRAFFRQQGISADWDAIEATPAERLINSLSMICPFGPSEKQALVEAPTLAERARALTALVEMAVLGGTNGGTLPPQ